MRDTYDAVKKDKKVVNALAATAKGFGKLAANSACCYIFHQPEMPNEMKKMRKF